MSSSKHFFEAVSISSLYQFWGSLVEAMEITEQNQKVVEQIAKHLYMPFYPMRHSWAQTEFKARQWD